MPYEEAFTRQKAEAIKAIELDGLLVRKPIAELANTAMTLDWDWPTAEVEFPPAPLEPQS